MVQAGNIHASDDNVDYDHSDDFSKFHTFQMADTSKGALAQSNQLMDQRVHDMVVQHMTALGMKEVTANPDLVVTYDASTRQNHVLNTFGAPMGPVGFGMGVAWRRFGGVGMATTSETTFTDGTTTKHIEKSLDELFKKWQKILAKEEGEQALKKGAGPIRPLVRAIGIQPDTIRRGQDSGYCNSGSGRHSVAARSPAPGCVFRTRKSPAYPLRSAASRRRRAPA